MQRSRRKRKTGLRLMVPNSIALAIRTGSRPVIPEKLAQITKRPVAPVKMHKWDAPNWMLVARLAIDKKPEVRFRPKAGISDKHGRQMIYYERYVETWLSPPFATGIPDHGCGRRRRDAARAGMAARGGRWG